MWAYFITPSSLPLQWEGTLQLGSWNVYALFRNVFKIVFTAVFEGSLYGAAQGFSHNVPLQAAPGLC